MRFFKDVTFFADDGVGCHVTDASTESGLAYAALVIEPPKDGSDNSGWQSITIFFQDIRQISALRDELDRALKEVGDGQV